jgi:uncharacterized protein (DUF2147 family)
MKKLLLITSLLCFVVANSQEVVGKWKTIDDNTGEAKSIIDIYEEDGKIYGKVEKILVQRRKNPTCRNCKGEDKDKPILGLVIIKGLEKDGDEYNSGKILDPESGNLYKCYIELEEEDKLKVRGYIGFSVFGRTQYWERAK